MAWYLLHSQGLSLMDGEYEQDFIDDLEPGTTLYLDSLRKRAGNLVVDLKRLRPEAKPLPPEIEHPHGVWIWELAKLPRDYLARLKSAGVRRVYLKVFDDASRGNGFWSWQCTEAIVQSFNQAGIEVWGWGYHFDKRTIIDPAAQAEVLRVAASRGLAGYVVDVEQEVKDEDTHALLYNLLVNLRNVFPGKLGYTSFGAPQYHREVPWRMLNDGCDFQFPQIYFEKFKFGVDWRTEVEQCLAAHKDLKLDKPILPIFSSESDAKPPATVQELQAALDAFPGSSLWRAPNSGERGNAWVLQYS